MLELRQWFGALSALKIRGKLILSFTLVIIVFLSTLGAITYFTFKDSISASKQQVTELSVKNHTLVFVSLAKDIANSLTTIADSVAQSDSADRRTEIQQAIIRKINSDPYITSGTITQQGSAIHGSLESVPPALLNAAKSTEQKAPALVAIESDIWAQTTFTLPNNSSLVVFFQLDTNAIWRETLASTLREKQSIVFLANDHRVLLTHIESPDDSDSQVLTELLSFTTDRERFTQITELTHQSTNMVHTGSTHVVSSSLALFDWQLFIVLADESYLGDLIKLKNRIITATILTFWLSLWIVLIVAHRISKPLIDLSETTQHIQKNSYSTPLSISPRKDEIGDLANNFEAMRQHIEQLISVDTLTGIFNRRYLLQFMDNQLSLALKNGDPLSFIMIDLDHFKAVNDTYGHGAGDQVLKATAEAMASEVRQDDIAARYGGEEFCAVLPKTDAPEALLIAERIRHAVEALTIRCDDTPLRVTCSLGIADLASVQDHGSMTRQTLMSALMGQADAALYLAKSSGRNCSHIYTPALSGEGKAA